MGDRIKAYFEAIPLTKLLILGYGIIILLGTLLLSLPISSRSGEFSSLEDAFFTSTSATCVTGLLVHDTYTYWSYFGQIVILCLVQIGGVGFMSIAIFMLTLTKQKIGLKQRFSMAESVNAPHLGGIVKLTRYIFIGSVMFETIGAVLLSFRFIPKLGFWKGVYFSIFHSVSAFCNAGIDLMGNFEPYSSLNTVSTDVLFNVTITVLLFIGGVGFFVWHDIIEHKLAFRFYRLQTKIVLTTSLALIFGGALLIMLLEHNSAAFEGMNVFEKIMNSIFQSATMRTAGFTTVDIGFFRESTLAIMTIMMLIGGSPGSTAGGIKTTTFAVMFMSIICVFKKKKSIECFKRRISDDIVHNAVCIVMLYATLITVVSLFISSFDKVTMFDSVLETIAAISTTGCYRGITPYLSIPSHVLLAILMFVGRIGGITVLMAFSRSSHSCKSQLPVEKINVG